MTAALLATMLGSLTVAQASTGAGQPAIPVPVSGSVATPQATPPNPQPTPAYRFIYRPAPQSNGDPAQSSAPAILEIDLTDQVIVTPTELNVRVVTNSAVVSVTAEALGHTIALPQVVPGLFGFSTTLRSAPNSLRNRSFDVQFVAADAGGRTASVTLPLTLK